MHFSGGGGRFSVLVFIIISSWFLCEKIKFINRVFYTWFSTFFWSTSVGLWFFIVSGNYPFFIKHFFPITSNVVWFISNYIFVLLLAPFMNKMLDSFNVKYMLIVFGILFCVIKMVYPNSGLWISDLDLFLFVYLLTGFIKLQTTFRPKMVPCALVFLLSYIVEIVWFAYFDSAYNYLPIIPIMGYSKWMFFSNLQFLLPLISAYSLFGMFANINIPSGLLTRSINYISDGLLGVYVCLSMDGPSGHLWWGDYFNLSSSNLWEIYICIIFVFFAVDFLDHLRMRIIKHLLSTNVFKKAINWAEQRYCMTKL